MINKPLFDKVLIANRGEIALRIIKTLKKMGIKSIAVYSEADTNSLHVQYADDAYFIGNSPATESYLSIPHIINAIRTSGAQAVHPGYGFLAENPNFALALKREGITLIGPSINSIIKMGDKIEAKKIAIEAGVSTVPGYMGTINTIEQAIEIAKEITFPVIVKAAAGGGGRGMRVVNNPTEMQAAYDSARLEAESNFNDSRVFIEKLIQKPRHIEIQLLADKYSNGICLGERECSIQRHHQKIIEEAPSPFIDYDTRQKMYKQVLELAKKVNYYSAGTVEFIVDMNQNFYFLEMNTRLQVEHPVTELITGIDIIEEMIRIAANEKLRYKQDDIKLNGHAIECRIYAEDPQRGFLPSSGRITEYEEPIPSTHVRIDSAVRAGSEVSMFYDPMVAKLCTHHNTRTEAIEYMSTALGSFIIRGIAHNITFLEAIMSHTRFIEGNINTNFIHEEYPDGFVGADLTSEITEVFLAVAIHIFISEQKRVATIADQIIKQAKNIGTRWIVTIDDKTFPVIIKPVQDGYNIRQSYNRIYIRSNWTVGSRLFSCTVNGRKANVKVDYIRTKYNLTYAGITVKAYVQSPQLAQLESLITKQQVVEVQTELTAPLSGQIIDVKVAVGDKVVEGQELIILTAMKMENVIYSERNGKIKDIFIKAGEHVYYGQNLLEFDE